MDSKPSQKPMLWRRTLCINKLKADWRLILYLEWQTRMWLCLLSSQILLKLNRGTLKLSKWMCLFVLCVQCSHQTFQLIVKLAVSARLKFNSEKKPNKRWNCWNILTKHQVDLRWSKSPRQNLLMIIKSWRSGHWTFLLSVWLFTIHLSLEGGKREKIWCNNFDTIFWRYLPRGTKVRGSRKSWQGEFCSRATFSSEIG